MELMFEIISRHRFSQDIKASYVFNEAGGYIGRSEESDWILPDRSKKISRKHALITSDGRDFFIEDASSNGIISTFTHEAVADQGRHKIIHGDSFKIGDYVIQARLLRMPETYVSPLPGEAYDPIIPDDDFLDTDPLKALDRQEEKAVRQRMGFNNDDLLKDSLGKEDLGSVSDHNESRLDAMPKMKAVTELRFGGASGGLKFNFKAHDQERPAPATDLSGRLKSSADNLKRLAAGLTEAAKELELIAAMSPMSPEPAGEDEKEG